MGVVKTWNGIARASVKTFDGIAAASVKTINGYDATSGSSYTLQQTFGADTANGSNIQSAANRTYAVSICTPDANYTITRVDLRMLRVDGGGSAPTLTARIYSDSSTVPNTLLASSTNTVVSADVGTSMQWVTFYFSGLAVTSGTPIWIGVSGNTSNASNYYVFRGGAISSGTVDNSTAGSSWATLSTRAWYIQAYVSP